MNNVLDYIERYKFAIIGTVMFHILVFAMTNFTTMKRPYAQADPEVSVEVPLDEIILDPEIMEMLEMTKKVQPSASEELYNLSADQNDTREKSFEEFSTQSIDENVNKSVEELEQEYKDYWASQHEEEANSSSANKNDALEKNVPAKKSSTGANIQNNGDNAFAGRVMVSYSLPERKAFGLPVPGYTCNGSGIVVIDVKVDKNGAVKGTSYNQAFSSGATECMVSKAMSYAKKSRFNLATTSSAFQGGTITYEFKGK